MLTWNRTRRTGVLSLVLKFKSTIDAHFSLAKSRHSLVGIEFRPDAEKKGVGRK